MVKRAASSNERASSFSYDIGELLKGDRKGQTIANVIGVRRTQNN
jgi:hypothetical protein